MTTTPTFWGQETVITRDPASFISRVVGLADNTFAIVATNGTDIMGQHRNEVGALIGGDFMAAASQTNKPISSPHIVQRADGRVFVDYDFVFSATDTDIYTQTLNADLSSRGPAAGVEFSSDTDLLYDTTALANGGTASVMLHEDRVALRFYGEGGGRFPADNPIQIDGPAGIQRNATIAAFSNDNVAVAYQNFDAGLRTVRLAIVRPDGVQVNFVVGDTGNPSLPDIAQLRGDPFHPGSEVVVVFQDTGAGGIYFRRYTEDGVVVDAMPKLIPGSANSISAKVTALNDGGFIVAWVNLDGRETDGSVEQEIYLQRYNSNGTAVGERLEIDRAGDQTISSIATLDDGRVIITFQSETGDSTNVSTLNYIIVDPREKTIGGTNGADNIVSREDGATLLGGGGADTLIGRAAADRLDGGNGADTMRGGGGNDTYLVDDSADVVVELAGAGSDRVLTSGNYTLAANAEIELFSTSNSTSTKELELTGNQFAQTIQGNAGNNIIRGGGGADELIGLDANDDYYISDARAVIFETATEGAADRVFASVSYTLSAGAHVEIMGTTAPSSTAAINLTGNEFAQRMTGNGGGNILNGRGGADMMIGGLGNDTYVVDNAGDRVIEANGAGVDTVNSAVSFSLAGQFIENLRLLGTANINATGNTLANVLLGNVGANLLNGGIGKDSLLAGAGRDTLIGGQGNDVLRGGTGSDRLTGGAENDRFVFDTALGAANVDTVTDFSVVNDSFALDNAIFRALTTTGALSAGAFRASAGGMARDATDRVLYDTATGRLFYDADGTGAAARVHFATIGGGLSLTNADFFVI